MSTAILSHTKIRITIRRCCWALLKFIESWSLREKLNMILGYGRSVRAPDSSLFLDQGCRCHHLGFKPPECLWLRFENEKWYCFAAGCNWLIRLIGALCVPGSYCVNTELQGMSLGFLVWWRHRTRAKDICKGLRCFASIAFLVLFGPVWVCAYYAFSIWIW